MSAPPAARWCNTCKTAAVVRTVKTTIPGTAPVVLALCHCDYAACRSCHEPLSWTATKCPKCKTAA